MNIVSFITVFPSNCVSIEGSKVVLYALGVPGGKIVAKETRTSQLLTSRNKNHILRLENDTRCSKSTQEKWKEKTCNSL